MLAPTDQIQVVYDGECPFCTNYVGLMKLRKSIQKVELIDARTDHPTVRMLSLRGYDLNEGMVVVYNDEVHYGKDAVVALSALSGNLGLPGRIVSAILRSERRSAFLYPILKAGRRATLALLGRSKIA
jgi:predicted DCC family thiol-disulfide oxidoreductase YuxK